MHRAQVELRVGVPALSRRLEVLGGLLVVAIDAVAVHEHVAEAVLRGRVVLCGALAKVLERCQVVLLDTDTLRVHVPELRKGRGLGGGSGLAVEVEGLVDVGGQPARAVEVKVAQRQLCVYRPLERRVLVILCNASEKERFSREG